MKMHKVLWGLLVVGCGIMLLMAAFGLGVEYDAFRIIGSILLLGVAVTSIVKKEFFMFIIPLALIVYLWRAALGIADLNIWMLLGAAALLAVGLSIIFHQKHHVSVHVKKDGDWKASEETLTDNEFVNIDSSFGEHTKYIHANNLKRVTISSNFSSVKVYFDQCQISSEGLKIIISSNFSGIVLNVPKAWAIDNRISTFAGAVNDLDSLATGGDGKVELSGSVNFAEVKIVHI